MILRLSQKLAKKIRVSPTQSYPLNDNPYADWSAHLFTANRAQYVIVSNTASLYSVLMLGRGITDDSLLLDRALSSIGQFMAEDGLEYLFSRFVAPAASTVRFSKALNRSVTGSMNDLIQHAKFVLSEGELSASDVSCELNEVPLSAIEYRNPKETLKNLQLA